MQATDIIGWRANLERLVITLAMLSTASITNAEGPVALEYYGALPSTSLVTLSPDGSRVAMRSVSEGKDWITVFDPVNELFVAAVDAEDVNPRSIRFTNNEDLLMVAGETVRHYRVLRSFDYSAVYHFSLETKKVRALMQRAEIYPYQSGLGRVIGASADGKTVFIPAYVDGVGDGDPPYGIFKSTLGKRREPIVERGNKHTSDWFVNANGEALIREDYDEKTNQHQVWRVDGKQDTLLFQEETELRGINLVGLSADRESLVFIATSAELDGDQYLLMSMDDGSISDPGLGKDDAEIERVFTDINRVVLGVRYSGFFPKYHFFDESLNERIKNVQRRLPGLSSELVTWSNDFRSLIFNVEGGWSPGQYLMFNAGDPDPIPVGSARPAIPSDQVAAVYVEEYEARDGLKIPALITATKDVYDQGNAPLIMMPHGGPSSYDRFGFDWMAQYFASRGYIVMQPQFRGSSGFGRSFRLAGRGEWGGKMQTDLDDGVEYLIGTGRVDADRVCIVGASYGGYAALAAGAFSPDVYKCIVSFAGVSDLYQMLKTERADNGRDHWVYSYWSKQFGSDLAGKTFLQSISPAHHAASFEAPVLLLHGRDDTVVKYDQSKRMYKALKKQDKEVVYKLLKGEDHWLTQPETRMQTLREMAEFIEEHL